MTETMKLMAVLAHPDDKSMGMGTTFARYGAEGVETYLVCATRGERGWTGPEDEDPGMQEMARIRTAELLASAQVLDICQVFFLDYIDGDVDQVRPGDAIARIVHLVRLVRPQVVCTFNLDGAYGHPDHIAVSQFTAAALVCAADPSYPSPQSPHRVSKFYYMVGNSDLFAAYTRTLGDLSMEVDGSQTQRIPLAGLGDDGSHRRRTLLGDLVESRAVPCLPVGWHGRLNQDS